MTITLLHGNDLDWHLGDLTLPHVGVSAHSVDHVLALPPLDSVEREDGPGHLLGHVTLVHGLGHALPLIESLERAQTGTGVILDEKSRAELINLVVGGHTTKNREKDHVWTDLVVTDDGGEILGRSVDPLSSASETLETVDSRPGTNSDLGWSLNSDTILVLERI